MAAASDQSGRSPAPLAPGPLNLLTDVAGLWVGQAEDPAIKSGVTVVTGPRPFRASVHVMGGAPGTRETDLLAPDRTVSDVDALVLSGGSGFGLDACSGVVAGLEAAGRGLPVGSVRVPIVPGAILFDLLNGGAPWTANPYGALGRAAFERAAPGVFALGSVGAGTGALTAFEKGGLGSASLRLPGGTIVAALVAANPLGHVTTLGGQHFWAAPFEMGDEFGGRGPDPRGGLCLPWTSRKYTPDAAHPTTGADTAGANTTIAIVATDAALSKTECHRLAISAHDGIARAVVPAHTPNDGDLVFACATGPAGDGTGAGTDGRADAAVRDTLRDIGAAAAHCVARSIARGVYAATPAPGDRLPCYREVIDAGA